MSSAPTTKETLSGASVGEYRPAARGRIPMCSDRVGMQGMPGMQNNTRGPAHGPAPNLVGRPGVGMTTRRHRPQGGENLSFPALYPEGAI